MDKKLNREELLAQHARLASASDIDTYNFEELMTSFRTFIKYVALHDQNCLRLSVRKSVQIKLFEMMDRIPVDMDRSAEQCEDDRVAAWEFEASLSKQSTETALAHLVVLCMYDRVSAEFDTFGADAMVEMMLSSLACLGEEFCELFVDALIKRQA